MGAASGASLALSGPIDLSGHALTFVGAGTSSVPGAITGTGTLAQGGTGTLQLGGADTFTGTLAVNSGTVQFTASSVLTNGQDVTVVSGATLDVHDFTESLGSLAGAGSVTLGTTTGGALTVGGNGASTTFSGGISGTGAFAKVGAGTFTLTGASSFTGGTTLTAGTVIAGNNSAFSSGSVTFNGGALASDSGTRSLANSIVVNNVAGNQITGGNSITLTGAASGAGTIEVNFSDNTKSVTVNPSAANSFAPGMVRLTSGTLLLGGANKIGGSTGVNFNGGTLNTGGFSDTLGALTLSANSTLDFGTSNNVHLQFSSAAWTGGGLTVNNWTGTEFTSGNPDQFLVASAGPVDSTFLSEISFTGHAPGSIAFNVGGGLYEIVPVPEPATIFGAIGLVAFVGFRERRRIGRLFRKAA